MNDTGGPERPYRFIGKPLPRKEDERLVTGKGRFTDDFNLDGQAYAAMVRSSHIRVRGIVAIDVAVAKNMPGVLGVLQLRRRLRRRGRVKPIPHDPVRKTKYDMKLIRPGGCVVFAGPHVLLPADRVRHARRGTVAMVVAATKAQAMDAAEAIVVTAIRNCRLCCIPRTPWFPARRRCGTTALQQHLRRYDFQRRQAATDTAFLPAPQCMSSSRRSTSSAASPACRSNRAPRSLFAYDAATGRAIRSHAGSGGAVRQKPANFATVLGIALENLRVRSPTTSAAISARATAFSSNLALVLWAAKKTPDARGNSPQPARKPS